MKIYPSILSADFSKLGQEVRELTEAGADGIHLDVMDGKFVNNITFGMPIVRDLRKSTSLFFDVHLMIENPEKYIERFAEAGADLITFHLETVKEPIDAIKQIKAIGKKAGISVKPATPIPDIAVLRETDLVLVMSVEPGFGGQKYMEAADKKIEKLARIKYENNLEFEIEVDGGINKDNAKHVIDLGADILVMGSAICNAPNKKRMIEDLKNVNSKNSNE